MSDVLTKEQLSKLEIIKEVINLTYSGKIKSFHIDETLVDLRGVKSLVPEELLDKKLMISNKYIPLLCENFEIQTVVQHLCNDAKDVTVLTSEGKFLNLSVTNHSNQQLLKRFIYIYLVNADKFEFGIRMNEIFTKYFDYCITLILNNEIKSIKKDDTQLINLTKELLRMSRAFTSKNTGRHKDQWNLNVRESIHDVTTRYFVHPFLFIVEDGHLKTVELYSSSVDMYNYNKFTNLNNKFVEFVNKRLGVK